MIHKNDRGDQQNTAKGEKKMTIKKLLAMMLVFCMLLPLVACGEKPTENGDAEEVVDEMALRATDLSTLATEAIRTAEPNKHITAPQIYCIFQQCF